jgi:hypothetical protein
MRLSEAIRMGSLLIENPQAGNVKACAITMACLSMGHGNQQMILDYYTYILRTWPWVATAKVPCPCGNKHDSSLIPNEKLSGTEIIWAPFDQHVMNNTNGYTMTIEQLADFIASIEPVEQEPEECPTTATTTPTDAVAVR